ncbi:uncharacterized protein LOC132749218 [Ruditapes philippinarum]|uniref:uncharacterized protein LOC132749218 n=1 Tax=Ruditapes philippinarum TaxID=129788 RepID=UPI00295A6797|nr:uncharacterized protein LOC132749218 [Ruditapes philippinarum]
MQAYNALLRWKKASRESQEKKVTTLLSVVMEMGRKDLAEDIETKYKEFASQNESEGFDEVDMGMSRNRENNLYLQKTQPKLFDQSEQLIFERSKDAGDSTQCKTYMTRELKPETTAFVDLKTNSKSHTQSSDSLAIQPGPAMSLPPAPMVSLPPSKPIKELSDNVANTQQTDRTQDAVNILENSNSDRGAGGCILNEETHSNTGGPKAMEYIPVEDCISASQTEALNTQINMPGTQTVRQPPDDRNVNCNSAVNGEQNYKSQKSLSKDTDLSADAYGSFSYDRKPNSLHLHHGDSNPSSSYYVSRNANDADVASPDSGYSCSAAQTPLNEQIIPNKGSQSVEAVPTVIQKEGNQSQEAVSALKQNKGNQSQEAVPAVMQNKGNHSQEAVPAVIPIKGNQSQEAVPTLIQKTDNQAETSQEMSVKQTSQVSNDAETTSNTRPQNKRRSSSNEFEGEGGRVEKSISELDTSLSTTQGEPQSLGSRVLHSFISMLTRPELAYS